MKNMRAKTLPGGSPAVGENVSLLVLLTFT